MPGKRNNGNWKRRRICFFAGCRNEIKDRDEKFCPSCLAKMARAVEAKRKRLARQKAHA
jgi:rRNA maturation endonuclease Nob1